MIPALGELAVQWGGEREAEININYSGVMNAVIKFRAGCSAAHRAVRQQSSILSQLSKGL